MLRNELLLGEGVQDALDISGNSHVKQREIRINVKFFYDLFGGDIALGYFDSKSLDCRRIHSFDSLAEPAISRVIELPSRM